MIGLVAAAVVPASAEIRLSPNVVVLEPLDVLTRHTEHVEGVDWVGIDGHDAWALVAPDDPVFGGHVPVDPGVVAEAWRSVNAAFRARIALTIVCLPRPRAELPNSSAEDNVIYLSPGATPYGDAQASFLLAHEMGHCVHRELLRDDDAAGWRDYRRVRGIADESVYHDWAPHAYRPREIFAEDFRFLFGGRLANYSGSIENRDLPLPDEVAGLEAYLLGLTGESADAPDAAGWDVATLRVTPHPVRDWATFFVEGRAATLGPERSLVIVDVSGRTIARLTRRGLHDTGMRFDWDGTTLTGTRAAPGVFFASLDGRGPRASGRVVVAR